MALHPNGSSLLMPFDTPFSPKYAKDLGPYASQAAPVAPGEVDDEGVPSVVSPTESPETAWLREPEEPVARTGPIHPQPLSFQQA